MRGYLGLGSNLADRAANLRGARRALTDRGIEVVAASSVYETEPQGEVADQPDFLNACLEIETALRPDELLATCKDVESVLGRGSAARHGPRTIDVDLLLLGDVEHRSERLEVPHPELRSRRFVLAPLLELDPCLRLPDGTQLSDLIGSVEDQRVERRGPL